VREDVLPPQRLNLQKGQPRDDILLGLEPVGGKRTQHRRILGRQFDAALPSCKVGRSERL